MLICAVEVWGLSRLRRALQEWLCVEEGRLREGSRTEVLIPKRPPALSRQASCRSSGGMGIIPPEVSSARVALHKEGR
jgi:hypothetical protein